MALPDAVDPDRLAPGTVLADRYRIVEPLGRGGMGEVYHAEDLKLRQPVALKFLPRDIDREPEVIEQFLSEVRIARRITHPNVCRVFDVAEIDGRHCTSMELIEGGNLATLLKRVGCLTSTKVMEIGLDIAAGLDAIHRQGIVHRDLKPSNLMIDTEGRVRIADFGIARVVDEVDSFELSLGTPAYMAPEQIDGAAVTARSDLYSLGLVLYELVTGRPAFVAKSLRELFARRRELCRQGHRPVPPEEILEDFDPVLIDVIRQCLEPDPEDRPSSAGAVADALRVGADLAGTLLRTLLAYASGRAVSESVLARLQEQHGGRRAESEEGERILVFERPWNAIQFALALQRAEQVGKGEAGGQPPRVGIHFGEAEVSANGGWPVASGGAVEMARILVGLAMPGQTLLSRGAFDLGRQGTAGAESGEPRSQGLKWLAHGTYELDGEKGNLLEVFEVGEEGLAPLVPPSTAQGRSLRAIDTILGWRAAAGLAIPLRPGWRLERKVGEGGFGEVWFARHQDGGRRVFKFCYLASRLRSLQREITLFRLLKNELGERPDIARILDWNFDKAPYFLEVEHTNGGDLAEWAEERGGLAAIPMAERLEIAAQVATALQAAHSVGVLHKDIKPSNILMRNLRRGYRVLLADFGIGEVLEKGRLEAAGITAAGLTMASEELQAGTRLYMAPEVLEGKLATVQADIYAVGVLLYQMVVGDFSRALAPGWERDVEDECLRQDIAAAVDGRPEHRLASAGQLAEQIRSLEERRRGIEEEKRRLEKQREMAKRMRKYRWSVMGLAAVLVLSFLYLRVIQREAERTQRLLKVSESSLKLAVANDWLDKDPTLAGRVLLEVEDPEVKRSASDLLRRILQEPLAYAELAHDGPVRMADISPDGQRVLTASEDEKARLWDMATGELLRELLHDSAVLIGRFRPDGEHMLTATEGGTVRLWGPGGVPLQVFRHEARVTDGQFSRDGKRLVTASADGTAKVWDIEQDRPPIVLRHQDAVRQASFDPAGEYVLTASAAVATLWNLNALEESRVLWHDGRVLRAIFDPRGKRVLTTSRDGQVRLWEPSTGRLTLLSRKDRHLSLNRAAFDPTGKRVAVSSYEMIWAWELDGMRQVGEPVSLVGHDSAVMSLTFNKDGEYLLSASHDGSARFWPVPSEDTVRGRGKELVLRRHLDQVSFAALDPQNNRVVTTSQDGTARLWRLLPQEPRIALHPGELRGLDLSPLGDRFATASLSGTVRVWSMDDPAAAPLELDVGVPIEQAVFSPSGDRLALAAADGLLRVWDLAASSVRELPGHRGAIYQIDYHPSGRWIGTASADGTARVWSTERDHSIVLEHGSPVLEVVFDPTGERLATGTEVGPIGVWDLEGRSLRELLGHLKGVERLAFSPDGKFLLSGSFDGTARVWNLASAEELRVLRSGFGFFAVAFSQDGERLLAGSGDETVRVLERQAGDDPWGGEERVLYHPRVGGVLRASFDSEGERIVSGTSDGGVWIWNLSANAEPVVLRGHSAKVWGVAFEADRERVLSIAADGTVRVWQLQISELWSLLERSRRQCFGRSFRKDQFAELDDKTLKGLQECDEVASSGIFAGE